LELSQYARARSLLWDAQLRPAPFDCLFDPDPAGNRNTVQGLLRGRTYGVLAHRRRGHPLHGGSVVREDSTFAAVLVPETKATLVAFSADLALDGGCAVHPRADRATIDALWHSGAMGRARTGQHGSRGVVDVRAGILSVWTPGYLVHDDALDHLVDLTVDLAAAARAAYSRTDVLPRFDEALPPPSGWTRPGRPQEWLVPALASTSGPRFGLRSGRQAGVPDAGAHEVGRWAAVRDFAAGYASTRGLALEDGRAFDAAFPVPVGGWAQFACAGRHRGLPFRVAVTAQRNYLWEPRRSPAGIVAVAPAPADARDSWPMLVPGSGVLAGTWRGLRYVVDYAAGMNVSYADLDRVVAHLHRTVPGGAATAH